MTAGPMPEERLPEERLPEERLPEERGGGESTGGQQTGGDTMDGQQTGGPALPARPSGGPPPGKAVPPLPRQTDPQQSSRQWPIRQWPIRQWPVRPPWRRHARAIRAVGAGVAVPALLPAALLAFLLAGAAAAPDARAQTENPAWTDEQGNPGRILVSLDGMTPVSTPRAARFDPATNTFTYWIRTSAAPHSGEPDSDKWWVRIFVDGNIYFGGRIYGCITWEPSVGLGLAGGKWNDWRQVTFHLDKDCVRQAAGTDSVPDSVPDTLRITHQVWTNSNWRPVDDASPIVLSLSGGEQPPTGDPAGAPGTPAAPRVTSASVSSVTAAWTAPANDGPAITDYDYRHRVRSPQGAWTEVTGTTLTALSVTIAGLAEDTAYDVQVRASNAEGTGGWSASGSGSTDANAAPSFTSPATFDAAENQTAVGTVAASDSNAGDSVTGYTLQGGADRSRFSLVEATGVLAFASAPDFEAPADADADNDYVVVVRATSGTGERVKTADQTITVTVTDVDGEAPGAPAAPTVSSASVSSVTAAWTAPANDGPAITDYDYRHRVRSPQGAWTEVTGTTLTALSATIAGLAEDTAYDVQVRASNAEGTSGWSASGSGSTDANAAPSFTSPATFDAAENQTAVGTVAASDSNAGDSVTGYTLQGGADRSRFSLVEATGVLAFASTPDFEAPADADADNDYVVVVRATSGTGERVKTADQTITVTVTDVDGEAPGTPAAPRVMLAPGRAANGAAGLSVSWKAPPNEGRPPIAGYNLQCREEPGDTWRNAPPPDPATGTTAILGFDSCGPNATYNEDAAYEVRVQAVNAGGVSPWSPPGRLRTGTGTGTGIDGDAARKRRILRKSWIVRFARTVGGEVLDAVSGRLNGGSGTHVSLGGMSPGGMSPGGMSPGGMSPGGISPVGMSPVGLGGAGAPAGWRGTMRGGNRRALPPGSAFRLGAGGAAGAPAWTAWGRVGHARFRAGSGAGTDPAQSGGVTTAVAGADIARGRWLGGIAVSASEGAGAFGPAPDGAADEASGRLTNVYGYARYRAAEKIDVWGILGQGAGKLNILHEDGPALSAGLGMRMAAAGLRGELASPDPGGGPGETRGENGGAGIGLAVKADAMWVQARAAAARSDAGNFAAVRGEATRLRLALEGSRAFGLWDGRLTLTGEAGLRHDGGDADRGFGLLAGAGLHYRAQGYTFRASAHGVPAHAQKGFADWGVSGSLHIDPGARGRGLSLTLAPHWGGGSEGSGTRTSSGGVDALFAGGDGAAAGAPHRPRGGFAMQLGYGFAAFGGRFTATPEIGVALAGGAREYSLGWRLARAGADRDRHRGSLRLSVEGRRRESAGSRSESGSGSGWGAEHYIGVRLSARFQAEPQNRRRQ